MKKIAYYLKSSPILYSIYFYVMSFCFKVIGLFAGNDDHLILFNSYGGKKYDDSPRIIYEWMLQDKRFDAYKLVWALAEPESVSIPGRATVVKSDSFKYFITALRAKIWITNSSMERGLDFKKKKTICFNTWHGTTIKVMGIDIKDENKSFRSKINVRADIMLAQSTYDVEIFSHAFQLPEESFRVIGSPRNDRLANYTQDDVDQIKRKLGIPQDKIVLLYAPTFREYTRGVSNEVLMNVPMTLDKWQDKLGDRYVVLFRAHYEVAKHMKLDGYPMFLDVSSYPNLNELMMAADALISDYSSIYFDFSVMHKPIYCFAYDYDDYMSNRGMYLSLKDELPCEIHREEDALIKEILDFDITKESKRVRTAAFQQKFVTEYGHGAENSCNIIADLLGT